MAKYRKKPVVIEAFQITIETRWDNSDWPEWLHRAWQKGYDEVGALYPWLNPYMDDCDSSDELAIVTLEGLQKVSMNDYIIQGVMGEIYPCREDIFELTYETVE
jgi:hypothetical protein